MKQNHLILLSLFLLLFVAKMFSQSEQLKRETDLVFGYIEEIASLRAEVQNLENQPSKFEMMYKKLEFLYNRAREDYHRLESLKHENDIKLAIALSRIDSFEQGAKNDQSRIRLIEKEKDSLELNIQYLKKKINEINENIEIKARDLHDRILELKNKIRNQRQIVLQKSNRILINDYSDPCLLKNVYKINDISFNLFYIPIEGENIHEKQILANVHLKKMTDSRFIGYEVKLTREIDFQSNIISYHNKYPSRRENVKEKLENGTYQYFINIRGEEIPGCVFKII